MCGIAGYLTERGAPTDPASIRLMCDRIAHRGPDAEGYFSADGAVLGHRRLSIIDLAGGDQPLANEDGSVLTVFNGEIYNFQELRANLERRGHVFKTRSDTEVLVHLYEDVGERLTEHLNGMFAFAIWDARRRELLLARDRLGKKPLYYSFSVPGLRVCFASELKALTVLPGFPLRVNGKAVADFLALSYVPDPDTIYRDVFKLEAGHTLRISGSKTILRRYWSPRFDDSGARDRAAIADQLRELTRDAVERRMISDVPLGLFLSGGLDSSAVLGFMSRASSERVKTFSIGFTNRRFDELEFARLAAQHNGAEHREQVVTPAIHDALETITAHFDEPFGDPSTIPMLYLAKMTRRHVTVALSGDGADEVFGGYRRYYFGVIEERIREKFPSWFRRPVFGLAGRCYPKSDFLPQIFRGKTMLSNLSQDLANAYFTSMSVLRDNRLDAALSPELRRELSGYSPRESFRSKFESVRHLPPLQQLQHVDLMTYLPGDILVKADRTTMLYGLEARSPWLDYRIADLAFRLPSSFLIHGRTGKSIFREAVVPYLPPSLLRRKKMGFSPPLAQWFRTSLKPVFESLVLGPRNAGLLSQTEARRIWTEHQSELHNHDRKLWNLLMIACWAAAHGVADAAPHDRWTSACVVR